MLWIGFILTLLFIVAQLAGIIAWSWWLIFLPLIITGLITIMIWTAIALFAYALMREA